jgi:heme-binding NEAT domain protein
MLYGDDSKSIVDNSRYYIEMTVKSIVDNRYYMEMTAKSIVDNRYYMEMTAKLIVDNSRCYMAMTASQL